jgi:molybdopterin converting factor small subunit
MICGGMPEMKVKIRSTFAIGATQDPQGRSPSNGPMKVDVQPGTTVEELLEKLPSLGPKDQFDDIMIHVFVNGTLKGHNYVLQPGDVIDLHIPVSGG